MAFGLASLGITGIHITGQLSDMVCIVLLFGLLSAIMSPLHFLLTFPIVLVTVVPILLLLNVLVLWLTTLFAANGGIEFRIEGFWPTIEGAALIAVAQFATHGFLWNQRRTRILQNQPARIWIMEMEQYKRWLQEQVARWEELAKKRQQMIGEQEAVLDDLKPDQVKEEEIKAKPLS